jgi:hypothetical protein
VLVVKPPEQDRSVVKVSLIARGIPIGEPLGTKLDSRIRRPSAADSKLKLKFEIVDIPLPVQKLAFRERLTRGNFARDRPAFHPPVLGTPFPARQRAAVKNRRQRRHSGPRGREDNG